LRVLALALFVATCSTQDLGLPRLQQTCVAKFSLSYSCGGSYPLSALFLSTYAKQRNEPELLYDAACDSPASFATSTAGHDWGLIMDFGIDNLTTFSANNFWTKTRNYAINPFERGGFMTVQKEHVYGVFNVHSDIQAMWVFKIVDWMPPNGAMTITYSVLQYQVDTTIMESPGFDWAKPPMPMCMP